MIAETIQHESANAIFDLVFDEINPASNMFVISEDGVILIYILLPMTVETVRDYYLSRTTKHIKGILQRFE